MNPKHQTGFNLAFAKAINEDKTFAKQLELWNQYQKQYGSRFEFMKKSLRIDPVYPGKELIDLSLQDALIGTLPDLSVGKKTDKCSSISCALNAEKDGDGTLLPFHELYDKRNAAYKNSNTSKMTLDQMTNFQLLVRMDIQYLGSVDVDWKEREGGGASLAASRVEKDAVPAEDGRASRGEKDANPANDGGRKAVASDGSESQDMSSSQASQALTLLSTRSSATAAGSIARNEERLLRFALRTSELNGKGFDASLPSAGLLASPSASEEHDINDICKWDYRDGHFPRTPEGLKQMKFDHEVDNLPPKYVFPAAVLLFVSTNRNEEEEACFESLSREWDHWFDDALSYDILKKGPSKRLGLNSEESNWCLVTLEFLVKQIKSESDRKRLGLPQLSKRVDRSSEAALLPTKQREPRRSKVSPADEGIKEIAVVAAAPPAAPAQAATVVGGEGNAENESGSDAVKKVSRPRKRPASGEGTAAKRVRKVEDMEEDTGFETKVRPSDGKTVSLKDGRIVAAGNDLKKRFPNNYRNPDNKKKFYGKKLSISEAFKLACIVHYGPNIPIDQSGHLSIRAALFRTAAFYALTDEETKEIMAHPLVADFYFFHAKCSKQLVYATLTEGRLLFGDAVFCKNPPERLLRGTSNDISVHCAEIEFSNPFLSMQCIWAWNPRHPSWLARIGKGQGLPVADM